VKQLEYRLASFIELVCGEPDLPYLLMYNAMEAARDALRRSLVNSRASKDDRRIQGIPDRSRSRREGLESDYLCAGIDPCIS
jgi:hypothetical protein